jgi:hypothetical protein
MGLASAVPGSIDEDLERPPPLENVIRSITAGFRMVSVGLSRDEEEDEARASAEAWTGLRGVSLLPSTLGASSLLLRL